jgi:3-hydroxybutyrate dehydrogenase
MKTVALELAEKNVTVNAIAPRYVETPLVSNQVDATAKVRGITEKEVVDDLMLAAQPPKKFVTIEQDTDLTLFLCSQSSSSSITGVVIPVDGGWSAQ